MQTQLRFRSHSHPHLGVSAWPPSVTKPLQNRGFPIMLCYAKKQFLYGISRPWASAESMNINVLCEISPRPYWTLSAGQTPSPPFCHHAEQVVALVPAQALEMSQEPHSHFGKDGVKEKILQAWRIEFSLPWHPPSASVMKSTWYPYEEARYKHGTRHFGRVG